MKIKLPMTGLYRSKTQWYDNGRLLGDWNRIIQKGEKMGRIYVTGDIHSEPDRFNTENFRNRKK